MQRSILALSLTTVLFVMFYRRDNGICYKLNRMCRC